MRNPVWYWVIVTQLSSINRKLVIPSGFHPSLLFRLPFPLFWKCTLYMHTGLGCFYYEAGWIREAHFQRTSVQTCLNNISRRQNSNWWRMFKRSIIANKKKQMSCPYVSSYENQFADNRFPIPTSPPPPNLISTCPFSSIPPLNNLLSMLLKWNSFLLCVQKKQHFFSCPFVVWMFGFEAAVFLLCLRLTSLLWCFVGFRSAAIGSFRSVTPKIISNLLVKLLWLVLDRLVMDTSFSESSLTVFYRNSSNITWPRIKSCCQILCRWIGD